MSNSAPKLTIEALARIRQNGGVPPGYMPPGAPQRQAPSGFGGAPPAPGFPLVPATPGPSYGPPPGQRGDRPAPGVVMDAGVIPSAAQPVVLPPNVMAGNGESGNNVGAVRTVTPFGAYYDQIRSQDVTPWGEMYRASANNSWLNPAISADKPILFTIGTYTVPSGFVLLLTEYEFSLYTVGPLGTGAQPAPDGIMSTSLGFDLRLNGARPQRNIANQLIPSPVDVAASEFYVPANPSTRTPAANYANAEARRAAAATGAGTAILPNTKERFGPRRGPFTVYAMQGDTVTGDAILLKPVSEPIAFMQLKLTGQLLDIMTWQSIQKSVRLK